MIIESPIETSKRPELLMSNARTTFLNVEKSINESVLGRISDNSMVPSVEEMGFSGMKPIIGLQAREPIINNADPMTRRAMEEGSRLLSMSDNEKMASKANAIMSRYSEAEKAMPNGIVGLSESILLSMKKPPMPDTKSRMF